MKKKKKEKKHLSRAIRKMLPINSQNPFHVVPKCNTWPAPIPGSNACLSTIRNENIYHSGLKMKATASICIAPQYIALVPMLQSWCVSRAGKGLTVETEGLTVLELRGICRDAWEALTRFSPTQCLAPVYIFHIQLVWRLKCPRALNTEVYASKRGCARRMHAQRTWAEKANSAHRKPLSQSSVLCTFVVTSR